MAAVGLKGGHTLGNLLGNEISFTIDDTDRNYKGNVSVFDSNLKAVVITSESDNQVHLINLQNIGQLNVTKTSSQDTRYIFHQIDFAKVKQRHDNAVKERKMRIGDGVSGAAQQLFDKLANVFSDIRWDSQVIVVMGDVKISPPYLPDNCVGRSDSAVERLKLMVKRFHSESSEQLSSQT